MTERLCLRCDWTGETEEHTCPRCGASLYAMERREPAPPPRADIPDRPGSTSEVPEGRRGSFDAAGEEVLPAATADRGRRAVIVLALALTAAVAFGLTRDGEPDADRRFSEQGKAGAEPAGTTAPIAASTPPPLLPACSGDPTPPDLATPAEAVPGPTADYVFQSSLSSSLGTAPDLEEIKRGSSFFTVDRRTGTTVLRFTRGRGLALAPTTPAIPSTVYTIEILFRFDFLTGFRKIIDFKGGSVDDGLYLLDGCLTFYPKEQKALTTIGTDAYVQVILTRDSTNRVVGYVNGIRQFAFADRGGIGEVNGKKTLRFFVDDHTTTGEYSSGAVSQIRLFDQPLTSGEVAALACSEIIIASATASCRDPQQ